MKKILLISLFVFAIFFFPKLYNVYAVSEPEYNKNFKDNVDAFFANGTPITISDISGTTTITWSDGKQEITTSTLIFGGGTDSSDIEETNITMESGTVGHIFGGGFSDYFTRRALVKESNITINGGTITDSVFGGGLLYSVIDNANITVNNGKINSIYGGSVGYYNYGGIEHKASNLNKHGYYANLVDNSNIKIIDGTIENLYGGGQIYSAGNNVNIDILGGNLNKVTAGGLDGYTGYSNVNIEGGNIKLYQSIQKGSIEKVELKMTNGNIEYFYVGSSDSPNNTGTLKSMYADITGGTVDYLENGLNGGSPLELFEPDFIVNYIDNSVENDDMTFEPVEPSQNESNNIGIIFISIIGLFLFSIILFSIIFLIV